LFNGAGHQLVYYEDFIASESGEHFLDRHTTETAEDPLQMLIERGFRSAVVAAIDVLPEREKLLMGLYYEQELNLKEIGTIMGVTESRVSQLHTQAVSRLRTRLRETMWTGVA
ncbi:MAG: sigma-70 family RNA polymerase sigma factor, partial [Burkholderiaceae bacterium]|nr:sigma-70 family RNA polymerase sigma factor [Burkholderiaceae bacterium]